MIFCGNPGNDFNPAVAVLTADAIELANALPLDRPNIEAVQWKIADVVEQFGTYRREPCNLTLKPLLLTLQVLLDAVSGDAEAAPFLQSSTQPTH